MDWWVWLIVLVLIAAAMLVTFKIVERRLDASGEVHEEGDDAEAEAPVEPRREVGEGEGGEPGVGDPTS